MGQTPFRGVPHILKTDGWWLDDADGPARHGPAPRKARLMALALLVAAADLLFWRVPVGVSLPLFAGLVFGLGTLDVPLRRRGRPALLLALAALPTVDYVQTLSVAFLLTGLAVALVWARVRDTDPWLATGLAWIARLPHRWRAPFTLRADRIGRQAADLWMFGRTASRRVAPDGLQANLQANLRANLRDNLRDWAFPLGGLMVFGGLILRANPLILQALDWDIDLADLVERVLFWGGIALVLWPLLDRDLPTPATLPADLPNLGSRLGLRLGINRRSILRALVTFNAVIAVQTITDALIVAGGAALPDGMSYAEYAHRGAYPLLITALLACGVALAARPFLAEHRAVKPLMLLWLGQNLMLTAGAVLRLELYVDVYGLTYLRVHAFLWMGLVAILLALAVWQVARARSNRWLLWRGAAAGVALLYACCFVNFAGLIAEQNLTRRIGMPMDHGYACTLGPMAWRALETAHADSLLCDIDRPQAQDWREWGFRISRVGR